MVGYRGGREDGNLGGFGIYQHFNLLTYLYHISKFFFFFFVQKSY